MTKNTDRTFRNNPLWAGLNQAQQAAVALPNKHALILAGAGTGKTKTLVARIAAMLEDGVARPDQILAVTFTNKSAREMASRVAAAVGEEFSAALQIGTFHGAAYRWIRHDWEGFGFRKNAVVLDADDQRAVFRRVMKDNSWDEKRFPVKESLAFINSRKDAGLRPPQVKPATVQEVSMLEFYAAYEKQLKTENAIDFADLLLSIRDRLRDDDVFFEKMSGRWKLILVDEFQDTNPLQYDILERLVEKGGALFAVGDDDQSIYGFRGARVKNVFDFAEKYAKDRVIRLEENYRSSKNILEAANAVIRQNQQRMGKRLWTASGEGETVSIIKAANETEEAARVVSGVEELLSQGVDAGQIAILYRSNAQSRLFEQECLRRKVPYQMVGGLRFFDRAEIRDAMAHLRCAVSPDDVGAFCRAVTRPAFGVGAKRIERWRRAAALPGGRLSVEIDRAAHPEKGKADTAAEKWITHVERGRWLLENSGYAAGFSAWMREMGLKNSYEDDGRKDSRSDNLDELVNAISDFERKSKETGLSLEDFLADAVLNSGDSEGGVGVQLSTIHAAKGLEFESVFWVGLEEGMSPHARAIAEPGGLEEECRLAYVAMTRAKKRLTLTFAANRFFQGESRSAEPSRYLSAIPRGVLKALGTGWPPTPRPHSWTAANGIASSPGRSGRVGEEVGTGVAAPGSIWSNGQHVRHPMFGDGKILQVSGLGSATEVKVEFREGVRRLVASFAGLEALS